MRLEANGAKPNPSGLKPNPFSFNRMFKLKLCLKEGLIPILTPIVTDSESEKDDSHKQILHIYLRIIYIYTYK